VAPAAESPAKPERAHDATAASARSSKGTGLMVIALGNARRILGGRDFDAVLRLIEKKGRSAIRIRAESGRRS
jgi:hypothetical protein